MWAFKLEVKNSLRTKKFWVVVTLIVLVYIQAFYEIRNNLQSTSTPEQMLILSLIGYIAVSAYLFIGLFALMMGATVVNDDLAKGTARIALSKPISRISYFIGRFLGQIIAIFVALLISTVLSIIAAKHYGLQLTSSIIVNVILVNVLALLAMLQLLALGYLISICIRSPNTALGVALVLFLAMGLIMPQVVKNMAEDRVKEEFGIKSWKDYQKLSSEEKTQYIQRKRELQREYDLKYLFYAPNVQILDIVEQMEKETFENGKSNVKFLGLKYAIKENLNRLAVLIGLTIVYLGVAFAYFKRMDLR